jgi:uncharacterized protein YgiM (DUF1202 family)
MVTAAQEKISVLNDQFSFSIPDGVIRFRPYTDFSSDRDAEKYHENKISVWVSATNGNNITNESWRLSEELKNLVQKQWVEERHFLDLLNRINKNLVFTSGTGPFIIATSRSCIKYNGLIIGELCGYDGSEDEVAPNFYGYSIRLVVGDAIVSITIRLHDSNRNLAKQMSDYFYFETRSYNNYIWRNFTQMRDILYEKLNTGDYRGLPVEFQRLRETLDYILSTMKIQRYERGRFYKTEATLRLRTSASVTSEVIVTLPKDTQVTVIEEGRSQIIDGIAAKWVQIETPDGKQGWCFSGYLGL